MEGIYTLDDFEDELNDLWLHPEKSHLYWRGKWYEFSQLDQFKQREEIKYRYELMLPYILKNKGHYVNPYIIDWDRFLNENELTVFYSCRCSGIAFYPQYQVGKYFLDFGNPYFKVGLEVDSKTYHVHEKDVARDLELKKLGWTIYHLTSSEAYHSSKQNSYDFDLDFTDDEDNKEQSKYLETKLEGILDCIAFHSMGGHMYSPLQNTANRITKNHLFIK